jgi:NAD(P)-dependent dehydrogenase (short-subunit alcohol dehydrogenase family)
MSKVAVVTGGSRGIGRSICKQMAAHGKIVIPSKAGTLRSTIVERSLREGKTRLPQCWVAEPVLATDRGRV